MTRRKESDYVQHRRSKLVNRADDLMKGDTLDIQVILDDNRKLRITADLVLGVALFVDDEVYEITSHASVARIAEFLQAYRKAHADMKRRDKKEARK